jgi:hypothetical protein
LIEEAANEWLQDSPLVGSFFFQISQKKSGMERWGGEEKVKTRSI